LKEYTTKCLFTLSNDCLSPFGSSGESLCSS
jgi:hypothetical protein